MDASKIKALPISSVRIMGIKNGNESHDLEIGLPYLMKECNLIIEDVTAKNSYGLEQFLYQKLTATIYVINSNSLIRTLLKLLKNQQFCSARISLGAGAFHGRVGAFASQGNAEINIGFASIKCRDETTQGFLRYVLAISAISKQPIDIIEYQ